MSKSFTYSFRHVMLGRTFQRLVSGSTPLYLASPPQSHPPRVRFLRTQSKSDDFDFDPAPLGQDGDRGHPPGSRIIPATPTPGGFAIT